MDSGRDLPCGRGCPIRRSRDQRSLASPPGFSQRATSFIASWRQGIHQMPLTIRLITARSSSISHNPSLAGTSPAKPQISHRPGISANAAAAHTLSLPEKPRHAPVNRRPRITAPPFTPSSPVKQQSPSSLNPKANACFPLLRSVAALGPRRSRSILRMLLTRAPLCALGAIPLAAPERRCRARPSCCAAWRGGGGERNRTDDLLLAKQALSQLSYTPATRAPPELSGGGVSGALALRKPLAARERRCRGDMNAARRRSVSGGPGRI